MADEEIPSVSIESPPPPPPPLPLPPTASALPDVNSGISTISPQLPVLSLEVADMLAADLAGALHRRRSSTRSIKRKKFDDELVESSLIKTERGRLRPPSDVKPPVVLEPPPIATSVQSSVSTQQALAQVATAAVEKKKCSKSSSKRPKKSKPAHTTSAKDLGRWKAADDLALITAVQQTCDLTAVYLGIKFSCKFTLKEIQERWYALLYHPTLSKLALQAVKMLHPDVVATVQSRALFSKAEEKILGTVTSLSQPSVETFQELLQQNPASFYIRRTAKALYNHWLLMKQYHLLPDQSVQPIPKGDHVLNFSDAEDLIIDDELKDPRDSLVEQELRVADRRQKREIRHLEQELPKWQVLVDRVTGISPPDFDNQTLAVLRGRLVRYLMRSKEITLGRATKTNQIDVDLALEGPAWKISRRQGVIKLRSNTEFYIANEGSRPIFIDGKPVVKDGKEKLNNNSVVEISCLRFIFLINQDLINSIRQEGTKTTS